MTKASTDWIWARIGDLISDQGIFVDGDWVESKDQDPEGDVRLIQLADIGDGKYNDRSSRFLTSSKAQELRCTLLEKGDLLIARMPDPLGRACIFPGDPKPAVTVVDVCVVRTRSGVDHRWLMYMINAPESRRKVSGLQSGSTRKRISRKNLATILLPLAPLAEQRAIVAKIETLFSELDKGIEQLQTIKQQLKQYRQAVLKAAFEGKLTAAWRAEQQAAGTLPSTDNILAQVEKERDERYQQQLREWRQALNDWEAAGGKRSWRKKPRKPTEAVGSLAVGEHELGGLGELPAEWAWTRLEGLMDSGIQNGIYKPQSDYGSGCPIVRINDFQNGWCRPADELLLVRVSPEERELYALHEGDMLVNRVNSMTHLGKCLLVPESHEAALFESNMMRFRIAESVSQAFVVNYLQSPSGRQALTANAKWAVNQASINQKDVSSVPVPVMSAVEQSLIVEELELRFSVLDELGKGVGYALQQVDALRRSILARAFTGHLLTDAELAAVRSDPEYGPADKLLERIRADRGSGDQPLPSRRSRRESRPTSPSRLRSNTVEARSETE